MENFIKRGRSYAKRFRKKIEDLRNYKNNAEEKEKEEINGVLMQVNDLLEYRNKFIDAFKNGIFLSEYLKKSDDAAYDYVLKDVKNFIQEIKLMEEKINLSLFEYSFGLSSPADYAKMLINTSSNENKKIVAEIKDRISDLKDRIKEMSETGKQNADETLNIIEKIIDYNKDAQKIFQLASKFDKEKSELKFKKSIAERKKMLDKMTKRIKRLSEDKKTIIEENEKIINIVERILYFNQLEQQGSGLKILTPNQMLSRLPITLAQLKAGNNSEKRKNEIRQLLYSLYRQENLQNNSIKV